MRAVPGRGALTRRRAGRSPRSLAAPGAVGPFPRRSGFGTRAQRVGVTLLALTSPAPACSSPRPARILPFFLVMVSRSAGSRCSPHGSSPASPPSRGRPSVSRSSGRSRRSRPAGSSCSASPPTSLLAPAGRARRAADRSRARAAAGGCGAARRHRTADGLAQGPLLRAGARPRHVAGRRPRAADDRALRHGADPRRRCRLLRARRPDSLFPLATDVAANRPRAGGAVRRAQLLRALAGRARSRSRSTSRGAVAGLALGLATAVAIGGGILATGSRAGLLAAVVSPARARDRHTASAPSRLAASGTIAIAVVATAAVRRPDAELAPALRRAAARPRT